MQDFHGQGAASSQSSQPQDAVSLARQADSLNALGHHRRALRAASAALAVAPDMAPAWFQAGLAQQMLNHPEEAVGCYLEALRREPQMTAAHARLANIHALQGRYREARAFAQHALALAPGDAGAVMALARADLGECRLDDAEPRLLWLADQDDPMLKSIALGFLGDLRDAQGRTGEAFAAYRNAGEVSRASLPSPRESGSAQVRRITRAIESLTAQAWGAPLQ